MDLMINATQQTGIVPKIGLKTSNNTSPVLQPQKPDTFERTCPVNFTGGSNKSKQYEKTTETLKTIGQNAQLSLDGHLASEGWSGKVADSVSVL